MAVKTLERESILIKKGGHPLPRHLIIFTRTYTHTNRMDIVQKMRLHSQVDSLLVDDTKSANIHAMIVFAESDCSKVRKELISSISEHVSRRMRNDSENIRTKAIKLAQILIQKGPKEFRLEVTKFSNEIVRSIVNDEGVNFGRRSFELGKELNEIMFSSGSSSSSSSSFRQTMTNKIVGISGANSDNSNDSNNNSNATIANNKKQQRDATRVGGVSSLTGIEHASGLFKFAGEVSKNVAMKVGNTVNEITKENPRHRDLIDEEYTKSEMSGGSLADSMNKTKMNAMTTTKGPWGREESAAETKPTTTATTSSSFQKDSVVGAPSSSSSKDPLADLLGMMATESVPSVTTNVSSSSKISSEVWTLKGTGPSRETKNEVHISPLPHQLTPLEGSEEQKRVDSLCGVAGIKLVPDEQELLKLFEHIERRGLEPSLVVQAFIAVCILFMLCLQYMFSIVLYLSY